VLMIFGFIVLVLYIISVITMKLIILYIAIGLWFVGIILCNS